MARLLVFWFFYFIFFARCFILLLKRESGLLFVALQCRVALQRYYAGFVFRSKKEGRRLVPENARSQSWGS